MREFHTDWFPQRVRIVALPPERRLEGFDLSTFEIGQLYRVGERLAELLVVMDYGELDCPRDEHTSANRFVRLI